MSSNEWLIYSGSIPTSNSIDYMIYMDSSNTAPNLIDLDDYNFVYMNPKIMDLSRKRILKYEKI